MKTLTRLTPVRPLFLLGLLLCFLASSPTIAVDYSQIQKQIAPAVVFVDTQDSHGSGFVIDDAGLIVTACHIVDSGIFPLEVEGKSLRTVHVLFQNDPRIFVATVENDCRLLGTLERREAMLAVTKDDIAVLKIIGHLDEEGQFHPLEVPTGFSQLWLAREEPGISETVFVASFGGPFAEYSVSSGILSGEFSQLSILVDEEQLGLDFDWEIEALETTAQSTNEVGLRPGGFESWSGVRETTAQSTNEVGLRVLDLVVDGEMEKAGVQIGDLITAINGASLQFDDVETRLFSLVEDQKVPLSVQRGDGGSFQTEVFTSRFVTNQFWVPDYLWCFERRMNSLSEADFDAARKIDLTLARNTLQRVAALAETCAMVLVGVVGSDNEFHWVGIVVDSANTNIKLEKVSDSYLTPLGGEIVRQQITATLEAPRYLKVTALADFGASGGPVLNTSGQVIGSVNWGFNDPAPVYIVGSDIIRKYLPNQN